MAIQNDGRIIAAGISNDSANFALTRYGTAGSLDPTFGAGGIVITQFSGFTEGANSVLIQRDGKILAAGFAVNDGTSHDFALGRYNVDGSLDPTFGSGGKVTTDFFNNSDVGFDVALQADDKIVVAGAASPASQSAQDFGVVRYNANGSLDATFGLGGRVTTSSLSPSSTTEPSPSGSRVTARSSLPDSLFPKPTPTSCLLGIPLCLSTSAFKMTARGPSCVSVPRQGTTSF